MDGDRLALAEAEMAGAASEAAVRFRVAAAWLAEADRALDGLDRVTRGVGRWARGTGRLRRLGTRWRLWRRTSGSRR